MSQDPTSTADTGDVDTDNDLDLVNNKNDNNDEQDDDFEEDDGWEDDDAGDWGDEDDFKSLDDNTMPLRPMSQREMLEKHDKHVDVWECGKCDFKNNVWRSICLSCHSPNGDVIASLFNKNVACEASPDSNNKMESKTSKNNKLDKNSKNMKNAANPAQNANAALTGLAHMPPVHHFNDFSAPRGKKVKHGPKSGLSRELPKCKQCHAYIVEDLRHWHMSFCAPVPTEIEWNDKWYLPLTMVQMEAIHKIMNESGPASDACYDLLLGRIENLGFVKKDLDQMLSFMEWHVPITIRIPKNVIVNYLLKDPFLRTLFETGTGKGGNDQWSRKGWETRMFGDSYDKGAACERPKYGCLNVSMKKEGCTAAAGYGECYFVMKDMTCRWRTTLTDQDSMSANSKIGTLSSCNHVLNAFQDANLKDLVETAQKFYKKRAEESGLLFENDDKKSDKDGKDVQGAQGAQGVQGAQKAETSASTGNAASTGYGAYGGYGSKYHAYDSYFREVQIHGDVRCGVDISELWVPKIYKNDKKLKEFVTKYNVEMKIIDE